MTGQNALEVAEQRAETVSFTRDFDVFNPSTGGRTLLLKDFPSWSSCEGMLCISEHLRRDGWKAGYLS